MPSNASWFVSRDLYQEDIIVVFNIKLQTQWYFINALEMMRKWKKMEKFLYTSVIGSLMNAILCTQLDLSFLTKLVNHCYSNPNLILYEQLKGFFCYFKGTKDLFLYCKDGNLRLGEYSDVDWANDTYKHKFTIRNPFFA